MILPRICLLVALVGPASPFNRMKVVRYERQASCQCQTNDVILTINEQTEISCAAICGSHGSCVRPYYNKANNSCKLCGKPGKDRVTERDVTGLYQCWEEVTTPSDCLDVQREEEEATDGVYTVTTSMGTKVDVYCIMSKQGGGWTTMLRRFDGEVKFDREFGEYEAGFGDIAGEHWQGLRLIHEMTTNRPSDLHISSYGSVGILLFPDREHFEEWSNFSVGPDPNYALQIGHRINWTYDTVLDDDSSPLNESRGFGFSTKDNDVSRGECPMSKGQGGWWYNMCSDVNPTGEYLPPGTTTQTSMHNVNAYGYFALRKMTVMYKRRLI